MTISNIKKRLDAIEKVHKGEDIPGVYIYQGELSNVILEDSRYFVYIPDKFWEVSQRDMQ